MPPSASLVPTAQTRDALRRTVDDSPRPLAHILRALIVLLSDERLRVLEVARQAGVGRPTVKRWQQRFADGGLDAPAACQDASARQVCVLSMAPGRHATVLSVDEESQDPGSRQHTAGAAAHARQVRDLHP